MTWPIVLPLALGVAAVVQTGINRQIGQQWGTIVTSFASGMVLALTAALILVAASVFLGGQGAGAQPTSTPAWWWVFPGILGFCIVAGLPLSMDRIGAARVFFLMIGGQMVASLVWDAIFEHRAISVTRIAGIAFALVGATLVCFSD
jgi:transporter family-2 protein